MTPEQTTERIMTAIHPILRIHDNWNWDAQVGTLPDPAAIRETASKLESAVWNLRDIAGFDTALHLVWKTLKPVGNLPKSATAKQKLNAAERVTDALNIIWTFHNGICLHISA